jgi:hypothetical protein
MSPFLALSCPEHMRRLVRSWRKLTYARWIAIGVLTQNGDGQPSERIHCASAMPTYCGDLLVPCMKARISSCVSRPSLLLSIPLKIRS